MGLYEGDRRITTYYAYLSLFLFSMLGLVISPNLLQIYLFWELVGVSSFLLIGFWYHRKEVRSAAKKAFIMTRIGDIGLLIAISLVFWQIGTFELSELAKAIKAGELQETMITIIALLIFLAALSKSGQFPLHTWLPDAMVGPTPVSALIHAATMVAAVSIWLPIYFGSFKPPPFVLDVVAYIGGFTAIFAAVIAWRQNDIKRILAFSTVSQLGLMMLALGSLGFVAGIFHLVTHAFFKALLFLAAGVIIMRYGGEQDIPKDGRPVEQRVDTRFMVLHRLPGDGRNSTFFRLFLKRNDLSVDLCPSANGSSHCRSGCNLFYSALYLSALFSRLFRIVSRGKEVGAFS